MATIQWITNSGTSDWSVSSNWSPASVPGAADSATIGVGGTVTVTVTAAESVGSLTLADANATVALSNSLTLGSTLDLTAGKFDLKSGGTLLSGTITGSGLLPQGGTMSGVTNFGTLDLSANASRLTVTNGITLFGSGGTGLGSVLLTGGNSYLTFTGTETFDNAAVSLGGTSGTAFFYATGASTTLTLGSSLSMTQTGNTRLYANSGASIVNAGTINAGKTNGTMYLRGNGSFTNQGTINVSNGDDFDVAAGVAFSNSGTITLSSAGKLHLRDNLSTGAIGTVSSSGGTVFIDGTLTNTGSVLATGTAGIGTVAVTGTIVGGTVTGSGLLGRNGTLSSVTNDGTLDLSTAASRLTVINGITLFGDTGTGLGTVLLTGGNSYLTFTGTETFDNAAVSLSGTSGTAFFYAIGASTTLTLGPSLSMTQTGNTRLYANSGASIVNAGTINAGKTNGTMYLRGNGSFTNQGTINVTNGDDFDVAAGVAFSNSGMITLSSAGKLHLHDNLTTGAIGTVNSTAGTVFIDGTLTNTGSVLTTGTAGIGTVAVTGLITGGTLSGGGLLAQSGTLSGVTVDGPLDLSRNGSRLTIKGAGITLTGTGGTGPGSLLLTGGNSYLTFNGNQTLDNATVSLGGTSGTAFFYATGGSSTLTLGPNLSITQTGRFVRLYSSFNDTIVNTGTIDAGLATGTMYIRGGGGFTNQGTISVSNGETFGASGVVFTNAAGVTLAVSGAGSSVQLGSAADSFSNQGTITLGSGSALHLGGSFTQGNIGTVTNSGGTVFIDGTLTNTGSVLSTGSAGLGTVALTGLVSGGTIDGGAMLSQSGTLSGVTVDGPLDLSRNGSRLTITGPGITLTGTSGTGPGSVLLTGGNSYLTFRGTQTLDNATVNIGGTSGVGFFYAAGAGTTLTLGTNLSITQTGRFARLYDNASDTIVNTGTINAGVSAGSMYVNGGGLFTNQGTINVSNGEYFDVVSTLSGSGTIGLASGASLRFGTVVGSGQVINFVDATDRLTIAQPSSFAGSIRGFQPGDTIDLRGIGLAASYTYNSTSHLLTLKNGGGTQIAQVTLTTSAAHPLFTLGTDGAGGTKFAVLSQSYFTGTYTSGIVLQYPAIQQPSTVAATGSVTNSTTAHNGDAVYGTNAAAWDFTNRGTITATRAASDGVHLTAGGIVTNGASGSSAALITGVANGVHITGATGTVVNFGTIDPVATVGNGVYLTAGGTVTNGASGVTGALISGYDGVRISGGPGTIVNFGTIESIGTGFGAQAVDLLAGGTVTNYGTIRGLGADASGINAGFAADVIINGAVGTTGALIEGWLNGIDQFSSVGTVINFGTVESTNGDAVYLQAGGTVTNYGGLAG